MEQGQPQAAQQQEAVQQQSAQQPSMQGVEQQTIQASQQQRMQAVEQQASAAQLAAQAEQPGESPQQQALPQRAQAQMQDAQAQAQDQPAQGAQVGAQPVSQPGTQSGAASASSPQQLGLGVPDGTNAALTSALLSALSGGPSPALVGVETSTAASQVIMANPDVAGEMEGVIKVESAAVIDVEKLVEAEEEVMAEQAPRAMHGADSGSNAARANAAEDEAKAKAKALLAEAKLRASRLADEMAAPTADCAAAEALGGTVWQAAKEKEDESAEARRQEERERRKRLWGAGPNSFFDPGDRAKPAANGWEHSTLESTASKGKFLRLMGGRELAEATGIIPTGPECLMVDDSDASSEFPTDVPCYELVDGEFVSVENAGDTAVSEETTLNRELTRQLQQQWDQSKRQGRRGLGAA